MSEFVFRAALRLYPSRIRTLFGAEMLDYMRVNYRRRATLRARARYWGAFCADLGPALWATWADRDPRSLDVPLMAFVRDVVRAVRDLLRHPGFAIPAVLTLVIGFGASAAVFTLLNGIVLAPLPYAEPEELVAIFEQNSPTNRFSLSVADFLAIEEMQRSFATVAAYTTGNPILTTADQPRRVRAAGVTAQYFTVLRAQPIEGPGFATGDDREGAERVAVLSASLRDRHFGPGADAVGRTLELDGDSYTVVGVQDPRFRGPIEPAVEVWIPVQLAEPTRRGPFFLRGLGRLAAGTSLDAAATDLADISKRIYPRWADSFRDETVVLTPYSLHEVVVGGVGDRLAMVFAAVSLVLLVAVANVVNLVLARSVGRSAEFAVRAALGASRRQLARLMVADASALAAVGSVGGLLVAGVALNAFQASAPGLPRLSAVAIGPATWGFVGVLAALSIVVFAAAPLALTSGASLLRGLRAGGRGAVGSPATRRLRSGLVVVEFALVLPLVVAGSLLTLSLLNLSRVDPGFDPHNAVAVSVSLPTAEYADPQTSETFWRSAAAALAELPGVQSVGISLGLPPDSPTFHNNFDLVDRPVESGTAEPVTPWAGVDDNALAALGLRLVEGRWFDEGLDDAANPDAPWNLVVTESWARRFYPGESAVGKQLYSGGNRDTPANIVGVIGDVKYDGLTSEGQTVYFPAYRFWQRSMSLVVRAQAVSAALMQNLGDTVAAIDPNLPAPDVETMESRLGDSIGSQRLWTRLLVFFAASALALTAIGLFGVLAHLVRQQTNEIGVRMALGADRAAIVRMVLGRGLLIAGFGMVLGLGLSVAATRTLDNLLFGVGRNDPLAVLAACGGLFAVALMAAYLPARRASRTDPVRAINAG